MSHAKSLRVIGQVLEAARVVTFELEKYGAQYMLWTVSLSNASELVIRNALRQHSHGSSSAIAAKPVFCFSGADISRLDAHAKKQRRHQLSSSTPSTKLMSHGLRTLGDHLDRMQVHAFRIDWNVNMINIEYQQSIGERTCRAVTFSELQHLCERSKARRRETGESLLIFS